MRLNITAETAFKVIAIDKDSVTVEIHAPAGSATRVWRIGDEYTNKVSLAMEIPTQPGTSYSLE